MDYILSFFCFICGGIFTLAIIVGISVVSGTFFAGLESIIISIRERRLMSWLKKSLSVSSLWR